MAQDKKYRKAAYILAVAGMLILAAASAFHLLRTFFIRTAADFFYPYLSLPVMGKQYLSDRTLLLQDKYTLALNLEALRQENQRLASRIAAMAEISVENEDLRRLLKLERRPGYEYVIASVLTRDPLEWRERFVINRGSDHGIKPGSVVLMENRRDLELALNREGDNAAGGYMVLGGIVKNVSRRTAEVITIYGQETKVAARLELSGLNGFINAESGVAVSHDGLIHLSYLPMNRQYKVGEPVVTAGFETNIPAGIPIGALAEVTDGQSVFDNSLYIHARVRPAADLENLRFVVVVSAR